MAQPRRSILVRVVLYFVSLLTLVIVTQSFWVPFVLAPDEEESRVNQADLFLQNPDHGDSVDFGWTIENTPSSDQEYAAGVTLNIRIAAALHTGNLSRDFYIAVYGSREFSQSDAAYCSVKSKVDFVSASIEPIESQSIERSVAGRILSTGGRYFRGTLSWSAEEDRTTDNPATLPQARIECPLSTTPWMYDNPDYHLRAPELRIVSPHAGTAKISSSTFCLNSYYRQEPDQTVSAIYPAATGNWGQYLNWKNCGSNSGLDAPNPYMAALWSDPPFEELRSGTVSLTVHDLEQAGQQVKVLFFAGAIAGIMAAIAVEILNVAVEALSGVTFRKRPEADSPLEPTGQKPSGEHTTTVVKPSTREPDVIDRQNADGEASTHSEKTARLNRSGVLPGALFAAALIGIAVGRALGRHGNRRGA